MKEMLREIFSDKQGHLSSKRILGAIALVFSLVATVVVMVCGYEHTILMYPYGVSATLLGVGTFESIGKGMGGK